MQEVPHQKLTPGYGSSHPACGDIRFQVVCPEDITHYKRLARYNCHRPSCPTCWPGWAARAADDAAARIEGYRLAHGISEKPRHFSFSPPPGTVTSLEDLYDQANRILRRVGVKAACVVPHPYALTSSEREDIPSRSWSNRYTEALESPTWRDRVRVFVHIHALVYGPLPSPEEFHRKTGGWTYRNFERSQGTRGRVGDELRGTIYYLLTHAWVAGNNAVVRYWFGLSNRHLARIQGDPEIRKEPCPVCNTDCVKTPPDIINDKGDAVPFYQDIRNAPVHVVKVKTWEYIVRQVVAPSSRGRGTAAGGPAAGGGSFLVQLGTNVTTDDETNGDGQ